MWFGPGWGIVAGLLTVAFWILVFVVIASVLRGMSGGRGGGTAASPALRTLEERYARGEITREEFLERRAVLTGASGRGQEAPPPPAEQSPPPR
jgi:putative membrane protein